MIFGKKYNSAPIHRGSVKTGILPETCGVERARQRHCQSTRQCWDCTELYRWVGKSRAEETHQPKLSAFKRETQTAQNPNGYQVCSVAQHSGDCDPCLKKDTKWSISRQISFFKRVFRLCRNICRSSKMASDIQSRCRCTIQQLSFEVIQMVLGKNSGVVGQGSGEASCEHRAAPGCRGHVHSANTSREGKHWVLEKDSSWPKLQMLWGSTEALGGYTREICSCDAQRTLGITAKSTAASLHCTPSSWPKRTNKKMIPMQNTNQEEKAEWIKIHHLGDGHSKPNTEKESYF